MSFLSIVIPVYRVETTLNRCIESVVNQDYGDFELILVDDGSPDNCPQICNAWATRDSRIRVVHKSNGGLSDARNAGIKMATGDYITFIDSDDYIAPDTLRLLTEVLKNRQDTGILEYPVFVAYGSDHQHRLDFPEEKVYTDMESYWFEGQAYQHTYACNKVFKRSLFGDIMFPSGVVFEDVHTLPLLLRKAQKVVTVNRGLYYYCYSHNGITATADGHALEMLLQPHVNIIQTSRRRDAAFYRYYLHVLNIQMDVYEATRHQPILPYIRPSLKGISGTLGIKAIMLNIFGIKRLCKINKVLHKAWRNR